MTVNPAVSDPRHTSVRFCLGFVAFFCLPLAFKVSVGRPQPLLFMVPAWVFLGWQALALKRLGRFRWWATRTVLGGVAGAVLFVGLSCLSAMGVMYFLEPRGVPGPEEKIAFMHGSIVAGLIAIVLALLASVPGTILALALFNRWRRQRERFPVTGLEAQNLTVGMLLVALALVCRVLLDWDLPF